MSGGFSHLQLRVARQIAEHARALSLPAGAHLSAQDLAREFGVSRTPVRKALLLLNEQGVARRQKNRGFYLERAASEIEERVFDKYQSEDESLYRRISEDRLSNRAPLRFTESEFIRQYGVNRSILGRILQRMSQEGLVRRNHGHGWEFLAIIDSVEAMAQSYRFRIATEPATLLEPRFKIDPKRFAISRRANIELLNSLNAGGSSTWMFEINADFHEMLAFCSGNPFFLQALQQQNRLRRLSEYKVFVEPERIAQSSRDHLAILDSLEAGRQHEAADRMCRHLVTGLKKTNRLRALPPQAGT
jgi:DNA-binding GntR family transcriptional regulator